ncbi:MAG: 4Fe-4S dicluster domain-containing protein [Gemmatimonadaceae bacterium]|nr:4Fe-4S dicluster domain-containing protein [Gemmatimonadaceae bacterium]
MSTSHEMTRMNEARSCALPGTPLAQAAAGLDACVHCGFCLQACPTYVNLEDENDSPRGRLVLMRRLLDGDIAPTDPDIGQHLDRCLGCRACETACPSGVPYGELIEATRATLAPIRGLPLVARLILRVFRVHVVLHTALFFARLFRNTRIPELLARHVPRRLGFPLAMLASTRARSIPVAPLVNSLPPTSLPPSKLPPVTLPQSAASTSLLTGCVMHGLLRHVNHATEETLAHNGFTLTATPGQRCCGALHAHAGDIEAARELARQNIAAFERSNPDTIVVNAAGCGAMFKQYGHLLQDDPVWAARASIISAKTRDVSELLATTGPVPGLQPVPVRVTHDPPCHQMHAQRVVTQPMKVLQSIPGLELVPLEDADQCCGSAGIYNLVEPDTSDAVLSPKLRRIAETHAQVLATGNPGCMMQLGAGLHLTGSDTIVKHPVELLAESYRGGTRPA